MNHTKSHEIAVSGNLDEHFDIEGFRESVKSVQQKKPATPICFDVAGLSRANSVGIFAWIKMLQQIKVPIHYKNVPSWLVMHFNKDTALTDNVWVESFYAPFYNEKEGKGVDKLIVTRVDVPILPDYSNFTFDNEILEGGVLDPDFDYEDYLMFLTQLTKNIGDQIA